MAKQILTKITEVLRGQKSGGDESLIRNMWLLDAQNRGENKYSCKKSCNCFSVQSEKNFRKTVKTLND